MASRRSSCSVDMPTGRHSSRRLQLEQATLKGSSRIGTGACLHGAVSLIEAFEYRPSSEHRVCRKAANASGRFERDQDGIGRALAQSRHESSRLPRHAETSLSDALLRRLDVPGPRYTSYPTADRFVEAFGAGEYRRALRQRAQGAVGRRRAAAVALRAHPVLRIAVLLLRLQQDHHQAPRAGAANTSTLLDKEIALHAGRAGPQRSRSRSCTWAAARRPF